MSTIISITHSSRKSQDSCNSPRNLSILYSTRFIICSTSYPCLHSIGQQSTTLSRLNIYYLFLEKMNSFAEGRYDVTSVPGSQIQTEYENSRGDGWRQVEDLNITKRIISTCLLSPLQLALLHLLTLTQAKLVQSNRSASSGSSIGRAPSVMTTSSVNSATTSRGMPPPSYIKKAPPPPPSQPSAPPPPYAFSATMNNATNHGVSAAATKRPPPPPPPLKPKPKPAPEYVTALYDFDAQVCVSCIVTAQTH